MKRFAALLLLIPTVLPLPAHAESCGHWTADMEEDEGGKVMTARVCKSTGNASHELSVQCGAPGELAMRFIPVAPTNYPPNDGNYTTRFRLTIGSQSSDYDSHYEDMDGAMSIRFAINDPVTALIQSGSEVTLSDVSGKVPSATFPLKGSQKAFDTVIKGCN